VNYAACANTTSPFPAGVRVTLVASVVASTLQVTTDIDRTFYCDPAPQSGIDAPEDVTGIVISETTIDYVD
jgi:hypothetical protein